MPAVRGNQRSDDLGVASGRGARFEGGGGAISAGTRFAPRLSQEKPERSPLAPRATTAGASERTGQDGSESAPAVIAHAAEPPPFGVASPGWLGAHLLTPRPTPPPPPPPI